MPHFSFDSATRIHHLDWTRNSSQRSLVLTSSIEEFRISTVGVNHVRLAEMRHPLGYDLIMANLNVDKGTVNGFVKHYPGNATSPGHFTVDSRSVLPRIEVRFLGEQGNHSFFGIFVPAANGQGLTNCGSFIFASQQRGFQMTLEDNFASSYAVAVMYLAGIAISRSGKYRAVENIVVAQVQARG